MEIYKTKTGTIGQDLTEDDLTHEQRGNKTNSFVKARALDEKDKRGIAFMAEYEKAKAEYSKINCT